MVKITEAGNDLEMMKNIDDKFQALLSEFYKNIDKSKVLAKKIKEPTNPDVDESYQDEREVNEDVSTQESEDEKSLDEEEVNNNPGPSEESQESENGGSQHGGEDETHHSEKESDKNEESDRDQLCIDSYTVGQMVEKLERKLQVKDDVSHEISRYRSGEYVIERSETPKVHFEDSKSIFSNSTLRRKRRNKRSVQFTLHNPEQVGKQLLPKASMTASSIGSKKRKKKKRYSTQSNNTVNWINYNRENLIKYYKKKEEEKQNRKKGRSNSAVVLRTVDKGIGNHDSPQESKVELTQSEKQKIPTGKNSLPVKPSSPPVSEKPLKPTRSAHSKCVAVETPAAKEMEVRQMSQAEQELFATIPFVVGRSISKTYHIGLSFQQTMSMIKRFSVNRDMVVTPIASCGGDPGFYSPEMSNHRCAALDRGDEEVEDSGWDMEAAKRRPRCTCLPEPKRVNSLRRVLRQLLARSEAARPTQEPISKVEENASPKSLRKSQTQSRTELLRKIQSVQLLLTTSVIA